MGERGYCCEVCERNPTCGVDCGSCIVDESPEEQRVAYDAWAAAWATPPEPAAPVVAGVDALTPDLFEPLEAPEPAVPPRVTPEDWQRLGEMQETAREVGERLAEVRERFGLEPDEAEREARAYWEHWASPDAAIASLATLLRAAEARGRERGLEEAARECERQRDGYAAERDECSRRGLTHLAQADQDKVSALVHAAVSIRALRSGR